jgi:hypothetical protein
MRRYGIFSLVTAAVLLLLTTWLAPKTLAWWFAPPIPVPISCNDAVEWGTTRLVHAQFWSLLVGLGAGPLLAFLTRKKAAAQAALGTGSAPSSTTATQDSAAKK